MDIFTSTVACVLQFRGGTQTVGKVGKVINFNGSCDLRQDTCLFGHGGVDPARTQVNPGVFGAFKL